MLDPREEFFQALNAAMANPSITGLCLRLLRTSCFELGLVVRPGLRFETEPLRLLFAAHPLDPFAAAYFGLTTFGRLPVGLRPHFGLATHPHFGLAT